MKQWKKCIVTVAIGTLGAIVNVNGQDSATSGSASLSPYNANELSFDAFGSGSIGKQTIDNISGNRVRENGRLGAGGGANYFFTRYLGIGGDAYTENTANHFIDSASGNLIVRMPVGNSVFAPYVFGGAGHDFDNVEQTYKQVGGGFEFRLWPGLGIFIDARYVFADRTEDYGVGRAGIRIPF